jgi:hypothetical protein
MANADASKAAKLKSLREWEMVIKRYPLSSPLGLGFQVLTTLGGNITIAWLVANGRMSPLELVLLVAIEAVMLVAIAMIHSKFVPKESLQEQHMPLRASLGTLAFGLFWLGCVYGLVLFAFVPSGDELHRLTADPVAFLLGSNLKWPLLITLVGALIDVLQDHAHIGRHGGQFISTPGLQGAARWMTLFLGGIPFFMPVVAVIALLVAIGKRIGQWLQKRQGGSKDFEAVVMTVMAPLMMVAFFGTFSGLVTSGVSGWAIGYATAKFISEIFVVCLPLIAKTAHAEETAALNEPGKGKRKGRLP